MFAINAFTTVFLVLNEILLKFKKTEHCTVPCNFFLKKVAMPVFKQ